MYIYIYLCIGGGRGFFLCEDIYIYWINLVYHANGWLWNVECIDIITLMRLQFMIIILSKNSSNHT